MGYKRTAGRHGPRKSVFSLPVGEKAAYLAAERAGRLARFVPGLRHSLKGTKQVGYTPRGNNGRVLGLCCRNILFYDPTQAGGGYYPDNGPKALRTDVWDGFFSILSNGKRIEREDKNVVPQRTCLPLSRTRFAPQGGTIR